MLVVVCVGVAKVPDAGEMLSESVREDVGKPPVDSPFQAVKSVTRTMIPRIKPAVEMGLNSPWPWPK